MNFKFSSYFLFEILTENCFLFIEGQNLALKFNCKFVETSVAINDKVDDLLVGILKQIRLNFGIDVDLKSFKDKTRNKNEDKMLHPIKEIIKTFNESSTNNEQETSIEKKNKNSFKNLKKQSQSFKSLRFFSKRQNSDTENIYDIDSSDVTTNPIKNNNKKEKNLSFFNKIFLHIFKRKSKRLLLRSVENLYTPVVVKQTY